VQVGQEWKAGGIVQSPAKDDGQPNDGSNQQRSNEPAHGGPEATSDFRRNISCTGLGQNEVVEVLWHSQGMDLVLRRCRNRNARKACDNNPWPGSIADLLPDNQI
jgi:hypothetical protein